MDGCPSGLLLHPSGESASKESVSEAENACGLLLRCWGLHVLEVDSRVLWSHLEMLGLRVRVLSEGLRA